MNDTFRLARFGSLFKKTLLERPAQMFGFTGLILIAVLILYAVCKIFIGFGGAQNITFIWGLAGGGCFLASFVYAYFSTNANGSSYLTLPASHFEKWLCGILIVAALYPTIFLVFYRIVDSSFVALYHSTLDPAAPFYKELYEQVYIFPFDGLIAGKVYKLFLFFSATMLLGSLYFNKVSFIKAGLIICVLCIAGFGLNWLFAIVFFGNINHAFPFALVVLPVGKEEGLIELPAYADHLVDICMGYLLPALLIGISFIRLSEKEF